MRGTRVFQSAVVAAVVGAAVLVGVAPAGATPAGVASAGRANVLLDGQPVQVAPVAQCSLTGKRSAMSNGADKQGVVRFGSATSTCTSNADQHTSTATSKGSDFTLTALRAYGGPTIKVAGYQVTCAATTNGTNASWQFSGLTGITVPKQIPSNFTIRVTSAAGAVLAVVTLNQVILPSPNDGSITMHMMHIRLFPNGVPKGAPMSGNIFVGSTACSPTA